MGNKKKRKAGLTNSERNARLKKAREAAKVRKTTDPSPGEGCWVYSDFMAKITACCIKSKTIPYLIVGVPIASSDKVSDAETGMAYIFRPSISKQYADKILTDCISEVDLLERRVVINDDVPPFDVHEYLREVKNLNLAAMDWPEQNDGYSIEPFLKSAIEQMYNSKIVPHLVVHGGRSGILANMFGVSGDRNSEGNISNHYVRILEAEKGPFPVHFNDAELRDIATIMMNQVRLKAKDVGELKVCRFEEGENLGVEFSIYGTKGLELSTYVIDPMFNVLMYLEEEYIGMMTDMTLYIQPVIDRLIRKAKMDSGESLETNPRFVIDQKTTLMRNGRFEI